ncbi:MAG: glycosyltransferase [Acidobacteriaceae bacterium]
MAVRNGANFIREQIGSILPQLRDGDEFLIVDDASSDDTVAIVEAFRDPRIRILRQTENRGVVQSFGHALDQATGDMIFLADHDDLWRSDKVTKFLDLFAARPDVTVAMSDLVIIDATGKIISGARFGSRTFHPGALRNIIRNRYQGSAMAFRRSILGAILPFPAGIPIHDMWIGIVNQFVGKAAFIPEPLLLYRRHGSNDSPATHASWSKMIRWRWALVKNLILWWLRGAG